MKQLKGELLYSALKNLSDAQIKCNIPTVDDFISCTKDNPLDWNAINNLQQSPNQPDTYFNAQNIAIQNCIEVIIAYSNLYRTNMVKSCINIIYTGCVKHCSMQYILLHVISKGLFLLPSTQISRRSIFLGTKHICWIFDLMYNKDIVHIKQLKVLWEKFFSHQKNEHSLYSWFFVHWWNIISTSWTFIRYWRYFKNI